MKMLTHFDKFAQQTTSQGVSGELRQTAYDYFSKHGFPTRKDENWKYTSVKVLSDESFVPVSPEAVSLSSETRADIESRLNSRFINLVFHNGVYNEELSTPLTNATGLTIRSVKTAQPGLGTFKDSFEALNTLFQTHHYQIEVPSEVSLEKNVNLLFYTSLDGGPAVMVHPRISLKSGARSSTRFLESYYGQGDARYFMNPLLSVDVGESAKLVFVRLQADGTRAVNVGRTEFNLAKHASLHSLVFSTGAMLARHNLNLELKNEGSSAIVDGVYLVKGQQHVDNATVIDHQVGGCNTSQHYKGILADQSRAVFNGKVVISKGAQKANSQQLNNNLLLSKAAEADSKPQLEVYADDVRASHGSTVGQLNREELFYLESRAISPEIAIPMLSFGYASELIYKIENPELQQWLNDELRKSFSGLTIGLV